MKHGRHCLRGADSLKQGEVAFIQSAGAKYVVFRVPERLKDVPLRAVLELLGKAARKMVALDILFNPADKI